MRQTVESDVTAGFLHEFTDLTQVFGQRGRWQWIASEYHSDEYLEDYRLLERSPAILRTPGRRRSSSSRLCIRVASL
jgi:hypothetical protein